MLNRRTFAAAAGTLSAAAFGLSPGFAAATRKNSAPDKLTVIAYNIYACTGWPKESPLAKLAVKKKQMAERLARELALYDPDIINFSESPSETLTLQIADLLKMNHVRFPSGGNWPGTLLSRFPITRSENTPLGFQRPKDLFTRHWGRAEITWPNDQTLVVHSAHLHPDPDPKIRLQEVYAILKSMKTDLEANRSMLLIGDLNHGPNSEEYKLWIDAGWVDTFAKVGIGDGLTIKSDQPEYRIDYVMATGPVAERITESRPLFEGAFRLNIDDKQAFALSDHLPQLARFGEQPTTRNP